MTARLQYCLIDLENGKDDNIRFCKAMIELCKNSPECLGGLQEVQAHCNIILESYKSLLQKSGPTAGAGLGVG